jgi:Cu/Ag efflux protein CusF
MRSATVMVAAAAFAFCTGAYAQQATFKGEITKLDEATGTVTLKQDQSGTVGGGASSATADYKVKDGLMFNAVKPGDKVQVTVDRVDGKSTITKLEKQ